MDGCSGSDTLHQRNYERQSSQLADTSLSWELRQHHETHYHPFLDATAGNYIVRQSAPEPAHYHAASNGYLEIILTATDSYRLSANVTIEVQPRLVYVNFDTVPSGLDVFLDGNPLTTLANATTWEGHSLHVDAPDQLLGRRSRFHLGRMKAISRTPFLSHLNLPSSLNSSALSLLPRLRPTRSSCIRRRSMYLSTRNVVSLPFSRMTAILWYSWEPQIILGM
jgi:hypothetical protein